MEKYFVLTVNAIGLIALIAYSVSVSHRLDSLTQEYKSTYNEFRELDKKYFPQLESTNIEIERNLNEPQYSQFPDSIKLKFINQRRLGSYFYDFKVNTDPVFALLKTGIEEQSINVRVLTIIGALSFLLNSFFFFKNRRKGHSS